MIDYSGNFLASSQSGRILCGLDSTAVDNLLSLVDDLGLVYERPRALSPSESRQLRAYRDEFYVRNRLKDYPLSRSRGSHWSVSQVSFDFEPVQLSLFDF